MRPSDILARYGGEEFGLALPGCPAERALAVVARLRTVTPGGQTCSAGIAWWDDSESAADVLGRADRALYDAKRRGRNQSALARAHGVLQPVEPGAGDEQGGDTSLASVRWLPRGQRSDPAVRKEPA